jgi:hypothetical protein
MSRLRGRLNKLERHAGSPGTCPVCRGKPPSGTVVKETDEAGNEVERGVPPCRGCGQRGPTLWITLAPDRPQ